MGITTITIEGGGMSRKKIEYFRGALFYWKIGDVFTCSVTINDNCETYYLSVQSISLKTGVLRLFRHFMRLDELCLSPDSFDKAIGHAKVIRKAFNN